jgi:hypothetical protein
VADVCVGQGFVASGRNKRVARLQFLAALSLGAGWDTF